MDAADAAMLPVPMTYEQYLAIPLEGGYDILNGVFVSRPGESWRHQRIIGNLLTAFLTFTKMHRFGYVLPLPLDVVIRRTPLQTRQPDVLFFTNERMNEGGGIDTEAPLEVGPNIAVEVLYRYENRQTIAEKLADYQKVGVQEAWLVYMESETVEVLQISEAGLQTVALYDKGQYAASGAVPGLCVALADIFDE